MKKFKYIALAGLLALSLTACSQNEAKEDGKEDVEVEVEKETPEKTEDKAEEEIKEGEAQERLVTIEREFYRDGVKPNIEEYEYFYDDGNESGEYTSLTSNFDLDGIKLIALEYEGDKLVEKEVLQVYSLNKGERLLVNAVYPEGIPMLKLRWAVENGEVKEDEYIFEYDGRDGGEDKIEFKYGN